MKEANQITSDWEEKSILIGVIHGKLSKAVVDEHLDELELLADTAGTTVAGRVVQRLARINPAFFVGRGKAEQLIHQAKELQVDLLIFDEDLSPAQIKNFQELANEIKVIDRSALILDIFRKHAKSKESKTQVELAHLQYLLPRLTRMWTHLERQMGGVGTRAGGGEMQIEVDRRMIRGRIARLKKELVRIEKERTIQSKRRQDHFRVALVGYTNAGKSTLMRTVSGEDIYIRDQLFATLDTTIRTVKLPYNHEILLSDTVGFIRKLPHHLVASFRSTLKEVEEASLILIVLDATSPQIGDHLHTIKAVLKELNADKTRTLLLLNKIDLINDNGQISYLKRQFPDGILISAKNHLRIDYLLDRIVEILNEDYQTIELSFGYNQGRELAAAQEGVTVLERSYEDTNVRLKIRGSKKRVNQIINSKN